MEPVPSPPASPLLFPDAPSAARGVGGFVRLTRFRLPPARCAELVDAARGMAWSRPTRLLPACALLVALDDGDWLEIAVSSARPDPSSDANYVGLAEQIVGDEDGAIVALNGIGSTTTL
ncbi:MAG: hypothetical protein J2P57_04670 [Acidimicrobiaceae bacterium]|nr:hypothetical protein [Acidimicrobiaceae bacterium]